MEWKPPRKPRPRDGWGRFRSQAEMLAERAADQAAARFESMQIGNEELYWEAQAAAEGE